MHEELDNRSVSLFMAEDIGVAPNPLAGVIPFPTGGENYSRCIFQLLTNNYFSHKSMDYNGFGPDSLFGLIRAKF